VKQAAVMLAMIYCASARAQAPASGDPSATFRIGGFLTNAVTGEPVRRGTVTLQFLAGPRPGQAMYNVVADAGGHFEIGGAVAGHYQLSAERRGYPRQNFGGGEGLLVSGDRTDILFRMAPFAALTGKVVDENGDAVSGAAIQLMRSELQDGRRVLRPSIATITDDRGEYRVAALTQGRYYLSAYARAQAASERTVYPRRFFPGSPDLATASGLELEAGGNQHADFRLTPEPAFHIRGQVRRWEELTGIAVALSFRNPAERFGGMGYPVRLGAEGRFELSSIAPGQYIVTATAYEGTAIRTASQLVSVGTSDVEGLSLTPQSGTDLSGQLTVDTKQGAGAPAITLSLVPEDFVTRPVYMAQFSGTREFRIPQVLPGDYTLRMNVPEPYYVKSASVGGMDALTGTVTVPDSGGIPTLMVAIGTNGGEVSGTVKLQDRAAAECVVLLMRRGGVSPSQDKLVQTDANGKFILTAVAPGEYGIYAFRSLKNVEYHNPQTMTQYSGADLTVTEGGKQAVDLKLNNTIF